MLLKKAYYNRKIVEKPRRKRGELEESCETASTQEGHDHQLIKEMKKAKPDMKKLHSLMTASFPHRRKWIVKQQGKGTVKKILEEYPGFNIYPVVMKINFNPLIQATLILWYIHDFFDPHC